MLIDAKLNVDDIGRVGDLAAAAELRGFDGIWVTEQTHSPWTLTTILAERTERIDIGTAIALAFPRSPMVTAYAAWDIQALSSGRFVLGLGTQVKGHIRRRFDAVWDEPGPRLRDYVRVLHHIWDAWSSDEPVDFHGDYYEIDLCPPYFAPEPIDKPRIPTFVAGVNPFNIQLAGHLCEGLHVHPLHSPAYIDEVVVPNLERGANRSDRDPDDVVVTASTLAITGSTNGELEDSRKAVRQQVAFYGSTRTYRRIFEVHGWGDIVDELHELSVNGKWDEMPTLITDEMLATFAVEGAWSDLRDELNRRYDRVDRVALYTPFADEAHWSTFLE